MAGGGSTARRHEQKEGHKREKVDEQIWNLYSTTAVPRFGFGSVCVCVFRRRLLVWSVLKTPFVLFMYEARA